MREHDRSSYDRREFLRRAAAAGIALPGMAAILAACGDGSSSAVGGSGGSTAGGLQLARPDTPLTLPIAADNAAIADGLQPEAGPLRIYGYADYIWKKVRNKFADQFGVDIEYTVFDTPEEMVAKVQTNGADFDLIVSVTIENLGKMTYGELLQPLNHSYLPNWDANAWAEVKDPFFDKGSQYTVPYTVYSTGIGYRNDLISDDIAAMDNPYDVLWDPKWSGQTHLLNGARDTLSAAQLRMGIDVNTTDPDELEQVKTMLLDGVDSMQWKFDHVDYNELGNFAIHQTWSGQMTYYQYYLPKDLPITAFSWVWPPTTPSGRAGIVTTDLFAIPKGAKNPVLAHEMINFMYDADNALSNYSYEGFQPPIVQYDPQEQIDGGIVPKNLANSLVTQDDFPLGDDPAKVQELELEPTVNQQYQQIYQQVTGGA
jgi:spermidine/putrescine transport system substrate-binding protein